MNPSVRLALLRCFPVLVASVLALAASPSRGEAQCRITDFRCLREAAANAAAKVVLPGGMAATCPVNNTFQCARAANVGDRIDGAVGSNNTRELFYRLSVQQPGTMQFVLNPMPNDGDVVLTITDAQYRELGRLQFFAGQPGERLLQLAAPGTYYVRLWSGGGTAERFSLQVANNPSSAPASPVAAAGTCPLNNTFQCAQPANVGERIDGAVGSNNTRELFYRLSVQQPGTMQFALNPMPNDGQVILTITDAQYRELGRLQFAAGEPGERMLRLGAPGTYYVRMWSGGPAAERFSLRVTPTR